MQFDYSAMEGDGRQMVSEGNVYKVEGLRFKRVGKVQPLFASVNKIGALRLSARAGALVTEMARERGYDLNALRANILMNQDERYIALELDSYGAYRLSRTRTSYQVSMQGILRERDLDHRLMQQMSVQLREDGLLVFGPWSNELGGE